MSINEKRNGKDVYPIEYYKKKSKIFNTNLFHMAHLKKIVIQ